MPKYYKREDVERFLKNKLYPILPELTVEAILRHLWQVPEVNALELNEDLEVMLKQLGYEKVVRCKDCKNRHNPKRCPYAEFEWLDETEVPSNFYCGNGEKNDG